MNINDGSENDNKQKRFSRREFLGIGALASASLLLASSQNGDPLLIDKARDTKSVQIKSIYPIPHENLATTVFGIRKRVTSITTLSELYRDGIIEGQKYELDCEITSTTHLLALLKILNPTTQKNYTVDEIIKLLPISENPKIGIHPSLTSILKTDNQDLRDLHFLPPGPYGIMPYPR